MVVVKKKKGESDERLINRFRKRVVSAGLIQLYRERSRYKKPSERRKERKYKMEYIRELEKKNDY